MAVEYYSSVLGPQSLSLYLTNSGSITNLPTLLHSPLPLAQLLVFVVVVCFVFLEAETGLLSSHPMFHSPNAHHGWGWARPKPQAGKAVGLPGSWPPTGLAGIQVLEQSPAASLGVH